MSARVINIGLVQRFAHDELVDQLELKTGVNLIVGDKDTGKTGWLHTISFLLGDTVTPTHALGVNIVAKFDSARLLLRVLPDKEIVLERRWNEPGSKHKIYVDGEPMASSEFSGWIQKLLGIPLVRFPKGNPYSGATWPELSWRMLFRHIYREERFWADLADKQPEREQHACLLQFLGVAERLFPPELGEEIRLHQELLHLRARRDQFDDVLQQAAKGLLADPAMSVAVSRDSIDAAIARFRADVNLLGRQREIILSDAIAPKDGALSQGAAFDFRLAEERVAAVAEREAASASVTATCRRIDELALYRANITAEVVRLQRVAVAEEVFRPLTVTRCPHCDQGVSPGKALPNTCFVCHQRLPWDGESRGPAATRRLAFEREQLEGETDELDEVLLRLETERGEALRLVKRLDASISELDVRLRPTRTALAVAPPAGLEGTATRVGQLEERIAQLLRLRDTIDQRDLLSRRIDAMEASVQHTSARVEEHGAGVAFEQLSQMMTDGINEYLNLLNEGDGNRWAHGNVRFRLSERSFSLQIGGAPWFSAIGATSRGLVLLGYHYSLLKLTSQSGCNYPGIALIDFPITLADGTSIAGKENYLVEPFIALTTAGRATQSIIAGRAFRGLRGVNRLQLKEVWTQTEATPPTAPEADSDGSS